MTQHSGSLYTVQSSMSTLAATFHCKLISNLSSIITSRSPLVSRLSRFLLSIELFCSRCTAFHLSKLNLIVLLLYQDPLCAHLYIILGTSVAPAMYLNIPLQVPLMSYFYSFLTQEIIDIMKITFFPGHF